MISIGRLDQADRADWEVLFGGYNDFYQRTLPQARYDRAWGEFQADTRMHALGAKRPGLQQALLVDPGVKRHGPAAV